MQPLPYLGQSMQHGLRCLGASSSSTGVSRTPRPRVLTSLALQPYYRGNGAQFDSVEACSRALPLFHQRRQYFTYLTAICQALRRKRVMLSQVRRLGLLGGGCGLMQACSIGKRRCINGREECVSLASSARQPHDPRLGLS